MVRLKMCFLFRMAIFHHVSLSEGNYPAKTHSLRLLKRRDIQGAEKCLQNIEYPIDFKTRKFLGVSSGRFSFDMTFLAFGHPPKEFKQFAAWDVRVPHLV